MSTLAMKPEGEMTSEQQRRLAFENLLMWTEAVITQRDRLDAARARLRSHAPAAPAFPARPTAEPADLVARALEGRLAIHAFNSERHLFINAAFQLVAYRSWVGKLGIVSNDEFRELDAFARDVDILRDKNEHAIDYFRGKGKRPDEWTHSTETSYTDASATFGNLLGGRLDYVELGKVAERLRDRLHELDTNMGGALPLTADQRRALEILADAGTRGCPEAVLTTMGFTIELLTQLLRAGFANRKVEPLSADYSPMKITETRQVEPLDHSAIGIAWMKITETGKLATGRINWRGQPANPAMR